MARAWDLARAATLTLAALLALPALIWGVLNVNRRLREIHEVLHSALSTFRDGDFSLRLAVRGDRELKTLKRLCNELADTIQAGRRELREKEILLDTTLQRAPVAMVLLDAVDRVVYSNTAARQLLAAGSSINGRALEEVPLAEPLRQAMASPGDSMFSHAEETFHLIQRGFRVNARAHRLLLIERVTDELRRREVAVWKQAIRVINHEINNTVAPISSLVHSARRAQERPEHQHRLDEIYGLIDERLAFLGRFLAGYAEFARLPRPHKQRTRWSEILDAVQPLYAFRQEGSPSLECEMDPAQMQQVVINLVKNAHESDSALEDIVVSIQLAGQDCVLRVLDRGRGMTEDVMRQALVPFYSTKPDGSGLGLALCNEIVEAHGGRMHLQGREGGGTAAVCWVPTASNAI